MSIATGTGDQGDSGLLGGVRVSKDHARLEAYGTMDELNAAISVALSHDIPEAVTAQLEQLSHWLFDLGTDFATPRAGLAEGPALRIGTVQIDALTEIGRASCRERV